MTGLAILLLLRQSKGSFGAAGITTGCYVAGLALIAPALGRLIDRRGPRFTLAVTGVLFPAALLALVHAAGGDAPTSVTLALALAAGGCFPPITVCMRTFLRQRLGEEHLLATAYSLESVLIELMFIAGPFLVALFVAYGSAALAVLFSAACAFAGTIVFLRSPALRFWRVERRSGAGLLGPLTEAGFVSLVSVILCYSIAFGMLEIGVTAYATEREHPALAGLLLGLLSAGSALGGLVYGSRSWGLSLTRQFASFLALMGAGIALLSVPGLPLGAFAPLCLVAGGAMAPALIVQSMLVAQIARAEHLTEAFTWSASALLAGIGLGFAVGGALLEVRASSAVLAAGAASALLAGLAALGLKRR